MIYLEIYPVMKNVVGAFEGLNTSHLSWQVLICIKNFVLTNLVMFVISSFPGTSDGASATNPGGQLC